MFRQTLRASARRVRKDRIDDLKETAPCGMLIHYTVDRISDFVTYRLTGYRISDFVTYNDINGRGNYRLYPDCAKCTWKGICKPMEADYLKILSDVLGREVKPLEVIEQMFERGGRNANQ